MRPALRCFIALAGVSLVSAPRVADACWDGERASFGRISLSLPSNDPSFEPARVLSFGQWLRRMDAVVPSTATVDVFGDFVTYCPGKGATCTDADTHAKGSLPALFATIAALAQATPVTQRQARLLATTVYTVQVGAGRSRVAARRLAAAIDAREEAFEGFYSFGGFPARNPAARVEITEQAGEPLYRIAVGAFLTLEDALAVAKQLTQQGQPTPFVRRL